MDLLRNPRYAVPLLCNVTGSVWFFILIGSHGKFIQKLALRYCAIVLPPGGRGSPGTVLKVFMVQYLTISSLELSLTVPIVNSLAFLFTVLGEWFAEGKIISRGKQAFSLVHPSADHAKDTWIGMVFVLGGIALCVQSKR